MGGTAIHKQVVKNGSQTVALGTTNYVIAIPGGGMPSAGYDVYFNGGLAVGMSATGVSATQFTLVLSVGIVGSVNWVAIEQIS